MKCKICDKDIKDDEPRINDMHIDCLADSLGELVEKYPVVNINLCKKESD